MAALYLVLRIQYLWRSRGDFWIIANARSLKNGCIFSGRNLFPHLDGNNGRSWSDCALRSRIYRPLAKAIRDLLQTSVIEQAGGQKRKAVRLFH